MTKREDESVSLKSRGVSSSGEILVGSIQVQAIMQSMVNDYELALENQQSELVRLRKENAELKRELELMRNRVRDTFDYCESVKKSLPIRDLEQKIEGVKSLLHNTVKTKDEEYVPVAHIVKVAGHYEALISELKERTK